MGKKIDFEERIKPILRKKNKLPNSFHTVFHSLGTKRAIEILVTIVFFLVSFDAHQIKC